MRSFAAARTSNSSAGNPHPPQRNSNAQRCRNRASVLAISYDVTTTENCSIKLPVRCNRAHTALLLACKIRYLAQVWHENKTHALTDIVLLLLSTDFQCAGLVLLKCKFRSYKQQETPRRRACHRACACCTTPAARRGWAPACKLGTQLGSVDSKSATRKGP